MSDSIKSFLFVFLICFGIFIFFFTIIRIANAYEAIERKEHAAICAPDHYAYGIVVADGLNKYTCMSDEGKERFIYFKKDIK